MSLVSNCFRDQFDTVEGSARALLPGNWHSYRQWAKFIANDGEVTVRRYTANPPGSFLPLTYHPPITNGEMVLRSDGEGEFDADLIPTRPMSIDLTGAGAFSATAALVVSMLAALSGSGSLTASIVGRLNATIDMSGSGGLDANMDGIASMVVGLLGVGDLDATIAAIGDMTIDIVVTGTGLSTANVGQAVWAALAAANNAPGTMGEKLNDAGSASNPWTEVIESGYTAAEILRLLAAHAAGAASGLENGSPVFKSLDGTKDRITGTYAAGDRGITDLDPSP